MRLYKRIFGLALVGVAAVSLGGCVVVKSTGSQKDLIGDVELSVSLCVNRPMTTGCTETTNFPGELGGTLQILVAFRVPAGTNAPATLAGISNDAPARNVSFSRSASYEAELRRLVPSGAGRKWVGYISSTYSNDPPPNNDPARAGSGTVRLTLPRNANGSPFAGPFRYRAVAGGRIVDADDAAGRKVDCGTDAFSNGSDNTVCIDSPLETQIANDDAPIQTRDLGIVTGSATLSPGQSASLPFDARLNGALPAGTTFAVTATSAIPGVTAVPSKTSFAPAPNTSTRIAVPIAIPKNAGPGTFPVTLTAALPNGQKRTGTGTVTIRDRQKPVLTNAKVKPKKFRPSKKPKKGANLTYTASEAATVKVTFQRCTKKRRGKCRKYTTRRGSLKQNAAKGANTLHLTGYLGRRKLPRGSYRLVITPTDLAGNRGKAVRAPFAIKK